MKDIDGVPIGPFAWPLERRLEYARKHARALIDRYPGIAEAWIREVERLERMASTGSVPAPDKEQQP
jgi:hypothetical protein